MALYYELQVFKDVYTLVQKVFLYTQELAFSGRKLHNKHETVTKTDK